MKTETRIFKRSDIQALMSLPEYIEIVEKAFGSYAEGKSLKPDLLHVDTKEGEFHIKVGGVTEPKTYFGLKCNGGFYQNKQKYGLPNIQGLILLYDGHKGSPLAIFESGDITIKRTGAATAVAAKYLSLEDADTATICGCGMQGRIQLLSLLEVRQLRQVYVYDKDAAAADIYAKEMSRQLEIPVTPTKDLEEAVQKSQIVVTCTPSRDFFIREEYAHEGQECQSQELPGKQVPDPLGIAKVKEHPPDHAEDQRPKEQPHKAQNDGF